jgi:hypothetical protein
MRKRRDRNRNDGGLMSLAALSAALVIGGINAALPKSAMADGRPSPSRRVDISLSMPQIAQSYCDSSGDRTDELRNFLGIGTRNRNPATLPSSTPVAARARSDGRWE